MDRKPRLIWPLSRGRRAAMMAAALLAVPQTAEAQTTPGAQPQPTQPQPTQPQPTQPQSSQSPSTQGQAGTTAERHDKPDDDQTLEKAGRIASQPVRDVGITKDKIPAVLQEAVAAPYAPPPRTTCPWLDYELARLNQVLGPDFVDNQKKNEDKAEKIALAGGEMVVNSLIPFRGLVREISGAAPADRRKAAAVNAGVARRGYLRGLVAVYRCETPRAAAIAAK